MSNYFNIPFDPTGYATITGGMLAQFGYGLAPAAGYGMNITTIDDAFGNPTIPNPVTTPLLAGFIWTRVGNASNGGVTLYVWNPNAASGTLYQWQVANINSITTGSITGSQIAALTITDNNIFSVGWSKLPSASAVGGCLVGSMPNPGLANNTVSASNIVANSVLFSNIGSSAQVAGNLLKADGAGNTAWFTPTKLVTAPLDASLAASPLQQVQVNAVGTGYQLSGHNILQIYSEQNHTTFSTTTVLGGNTAPTHSNCALNTNFGSGGTISFTPLSANSKLLIELDVKADNGGIYGFCVALVYGTTTIDFSFGAAPAAVGFGPAGISTRLSYWLNSPGTAAITFQVYLASVGGASTSYINPMGSPQNSTFKITEYL